MKTCLKSIFSVGIVMLASVLASCGGGGGDTPPPGTSVHGVAAVGAALSGATIYLKDSTPIDSKLPDGGGSKTISTTAAANGSFQFETSSLKPPFMLRARKPNGDFLYSISGANGGTVNINPLTNLLVGALTKTLANVTDPDALFLSFGSYSSQLAGASGQKKIDAAIKDMYAANLSREFKSAAAISDNPSTSTTAVADSNFLTGTYTIPSQLDSAFDKYKLYYDASSGLTQERNADIADLTSFGLGGKIVDLRSSAGSYTGSVVVNNNLVNIFANIDSKGKALVYVEGYGVAFGSLANLRNSSNNANGKMDLADIPGVLYYLDANGLSLTPSSVVNLDGHTGISLSENDKNGLKLSASSTCDSITGRVCVAGSVTATGSISRYGEFRVHPNSGTANWILQNWANSSNPTINATGGWVYVDNAAPQTQLASIGHDITVSFFGELNGSDSIDTSGLIRGLGGNIVYKTDLTLTANVQSDGGISISVPASIDGFPLNFVLHPDSKITYGNGLNSLENDRPAPRYEGKTLDGFIKVGSGNVSPGVLGAVSSGPVTVSNFSKYYTLPDTPSAACQVTWGARFWLEDLEFSTYQLSITETISNSKTASATNSCASAGTNTMVGRAVFTDNGLLAFLVDDGSKSNTLNQYAKVLVKYFPMPN